MIDLTTKLSGGSDHSRPTILTCGPTYGTIAESGSPKNARRMNTLVTLATSTAVLLHMLLGCCAHHAHAMDVTKCVHQPAVASCHSAGHDHGEGSDGTAHDDSSKAPGVPGERCDGPQCSFIASFLKVALPDASTQLVAFEVAPSPESLSLTLAICREARQIPVDPPLRTRARLQIFLI